MPTTPRFIRRGARAPVIVNPNPSVPPQPITFAYFWQANQTITEGNNPTIKVITATEGGPDCRLTVYDTSTGTATHSADYTFVQQSPGFPGLVTVTVEYNTVLKTSALAGTQGSRTVILGLKDASACTFINPTTHTVTIVDAIVSVSASVSASASGSAGGENLVENSNNYFVRSGGTGVGLAYSSAMSPTAVNTTNFSPGDRVWYEEGLEFTSAGINNATMMGNSSADRFIIGVFHRAGSMNLRGYSSSEASATVIKGCNSWGDHSGSALESIGAMFPATNANRGLLNFTRQNTFVRIEKITIANSGTDGIRAVSADSLLVTSASVFNVMGDAIGLRGTTGTRVRNCGLTGWGFGPKHYSLASEHAAAKATRANRTTISSCEIWDGWGVGVDARAAASGTIIDDCKIIDARNGGIRHDFSQHFLSRRNVIAATGKANYRSGSSRMPGLVLDSRTATLQEGATSADQTETGVITANLIAGCGIGVSFIGQIPGAAFENILIANNLVVDSSANYDDSNRRGKAGTNIVGNIWQQNSSARTNIGETSLNGAVASSNFFGGYGTSASLGNWNSDTNKFIGTVLGSSNFHNLAAWSSAAASDGHYTRDEVRALASAVVVNATPTTAGSWVESNSYVSARPYPASLTVDASTISTIDRLEFRGREIGPYVKTLGTKIFEPSHGIKTQGNHASVNGQDSYFTAMINSANSKFADSTLLRHAMYVIGWGAVEPTEGNYDWTRMYQVLDSLPSGRRAHIRIEPKSFNQTTDPLWIAPKNIRDAGETYEHKAGRVCGLWKDWVMTQAITFMQALADEFDGDPRLEMIVFKGESSFGWGGVTKPSSFDWDDVARNHDRELEAGVRAFNSTFYTAGMNNNNGGTATATWEHAYQLGCAIRDPDLGVSVGFNILRGISGSNYTPVRDYRGTIPACYVVSTPNLGASDNILPLSNVKSLLIDGKVTHATWATPAQSSGLNWGDIVNHVETEGNYLHTACPTQWGGCL